jgi:hypothetical protein
MGYNRRRFLSTVAAAAIPARLRLDHQQGEKVSVFYGQRPLLEYRYDTSRPKPYVHPLYLPDGRPATLDGPPDHVHHRGLMVAWSDVDGFDFWGETNPGPHGRIVHQRFERLAAARTVTITSLNHWVADGRALLIERRTLRVTEPPPEGVWLEWTSELQARDRAVSLGAGEHVYDGLGIRFIRSMDGGQVLNARGATEIPKANGEPAVWCTYYGPPGTGGVAILDYPSNPRHPTPFFIMNQPFGYLSAAPTFSKQPFPLKPGERLRFSWGVLSYLGGPNTEALNRRFRQWSKS